LLKINSEKIMQKNHFVKFTLIVFFAMLAHLVSAQTVYVTESGKKYHKKNCTIVKEGKKGIELKEATKQGYTACGTCKPDAKESTPAKKEEPKKTTEATDPKKKK
jgi:hypothetical protein